MTDSPRFLLSLLISLINVTASNSFSIVLQKFAPRPKEIEFDFKRELHPFPDDVCTDTSVPVTSVTVGSVYLNGFKTIHRKLVMIILFYNHMHKLVHFLSILPDTHFPR